MNTLFAFLHHVAAFMLVGSLAIEHSLIRLKLDRHVAQKLQRADIIFGICAGIILVVGLIRVFHFEKGASYYFHSIPFMIKIALFILMGLLSIYPTIQFISWRSHIRNNQDPVVPDHKITLIQRIIKYELAIAILMMLCAAMAARGVGVMS